MGHGVVFQLSVGVHILVHVSIQNHKHKLYYIFFFIVRFQTEQSLSIKKNKILLTKGQIEQKNIQIMILSRELYNSTDKDVTL